MSENKYLQPNLTEKPTAMEQAPEYDIIQTEHFRPKYAGFWIRFWAYSIDLLILSAISGIFIKPLFRVADIAISNPAFFLFTPFKITAVILMLTYFTFMTKFLNQTVGKMIMGIHVVSKDGERLTWAAVIFREVFGRFISKMLLIPYLLVIFMPKKEALHDLFADTLVTHENTYEKEIHLRYMNRPNGQQLQDGSIV